MDTVMCWKFETQEEYRARIAEWHRVFAWWPVVVSPGRKCWLMWVEQRAHYWHSRRFDGFTWEYRNVSA